MSAVTKLPPLSWITGYTHWLHTKWPAGTVEKLPEVREDGTTSVPGLRVVGDLTGVPLLKFAADSGAKAVQAILLEPDFKNAEPSEGVVDVAIVGASVSGVAAAIEAKTNNLSYKLFEASQPFSTIVNFPKGKHIFTYPTDFDPAGSFKVTASTKEELIEEMEQQRVSAGVEYTSARIEKIQRSGDHLVLHHAGGETTAARRVIIGIGRSGNFRKLGVPGEDLDKVSNRLHDPKDYIGKNVMVVGGGDSALEAAIALGACGANVTVSYRKPEFARPKPENIAKLQELSADPGMDVAIEHPTSERVTTAASSEMRGNKPPGSVTLALGTTVKGIREGEVTLLDKDKNEQVIPNDTVFAMIGREPPLDFFRRSGVPIRGEWSAASWVGLVAFFLFMIWLYHWKGSKAIPFYGYLPEWINPDPINLVNGIRNLGMWAQSQFGDPATLLGTLAISMTGPAFYYTAAYSLIIIIFGIRRIRRRKTPYVKVQTMSLMTIQVLPLFLLPELILPWLGHNGAFGSQSAVKGIPPAQVEAWNKLPTGADSMEMMTYDQAFDMGLFPVDLGVEKSMSGVVKNEWPGVVVQWPDTGRKISVNTKTGHLYFHDPTRDGSWLADQLFPIANNGNGREYWRAYGFILAWPLFVYNWFTPDPMWVWLIIGSIQTFLIIPGLIYFFGKGAYCGWICSCGALAETLGDQHRHKMLHGPLWNRVNMLGQIFLAFAVLIMIFRMAGWIMGPESWPAQAFMFLFHGLPLLNYAWLVDLLFAGIIGYGFYFWYSGRVWCRFACPLAALMHIYSRFSRFRIFADKKKCISCNVCTSVCHQGIDIMNFANKGMPMQDPECVRCSACVQSCPTGVLSFGRTGTNGEEIRENLPASLTQMAEQGQAKGEMPKRLMK